MAGAESSTWPTAMVPEGLWGGYVSTSQEVFRPGRLTLRKVCEPAEPTDILKSVTEDGAPETTGNVYSTLLVCTDTHKLLHLPHKFPRERARPDSEQVGRRRRSVRRQQAPEHLTHTRLLMKWMG